MLTISQPKMERSDMSNAAQTSNSEAIHSGHFMVSKLDDSSSEDETTVEFPKIKRSSDEDTPNILLSHDNCIASNNNVNTVSLGNSLSSESTSNPHQHHPHYSPSHHHQHLNHHHQHQHHHQLISKIGYDFRNACQKTTQLNFQFTNQESPSSSFGIDDSLSKLLECLTIAYRGQITSPKWNQFRGFKVSLKNKIRLNNIIWREYHMQFVKRKKPIVVQFASAISENHSDPESVILEGKYWKRQNGLIRNEYNRCRQFLRDLTTASRRGGQLTTNNSQHHETIDRTTSCSIQETMDFKYLSPSGNNLFVSSSSSSNVTGNTAAAAAQNLLYRKSGGVGSIPALNSSPPNLLLDDFMDFDDLGFFLDEPFSFPNPRDMAQLGNADIIQPGLLQLQPNCDDLNNLDLFSQFFNNNSNNNFIIQNAQQQQHQQQHHMHSHQQQQQQHYDAVQSSSFPEHTMSIEMINPMQSFTESASAAAASTVGGGVDILLSSEAMEVQRMDIGIDRDHHYANYTTTSTNNSTMQQDQQQQQQQQGKKNVYGEMYNNDASRTLYTTAIGSGGGGHQSDMNYRSSSTTSTSVFHPSSSSMDNKGTNNNKFSLNNHLVSTPPPPPPVTSKTNNTNIFARPSGPVRASNMKYGKTRPPVAIAPAPINRYRPVQQQGNNNNNNLSTPTTFNNQTVRHLFTPTTSNKLPPFALVSDCLTSTGAAGVGAGGVGAGGVGNNNTTARLGPATIMSIINEDEDSQRSTLIMSQHHQHQQQQHTQHSVETDSSNLSFSSSTSSPFPAESLAHRSISDYQTEEIDKVSMSEISGTRMMMALRQPSSFTIAHGFQLLQSLLHPNNNHHHHTKLGGSTSGGGGGGGSSSPSASLSPIIQTTTTTSKASKAALLHQAAEQIRRYKERLRAVEEDTARLQAEVAALQGNINNSCAQLPATGVVVNSQKAQQGQAWLNEYILMRSETQWKFYPFGLFLQQLFESYNTSISTASRSSFRNSVFHWLEQHCSLVKLRTLVATSMCTLNNETNIMEDPQRVAIEIHELVNKRLNGLHNKHNNLQNTQQQQQQQVKSSHRQRIVERRNSDEVRSSTMKQTILTPSSSLTSASSSSSGISPAFHSTARRRASDNVTTTTTTTTSSSSSSSNIHLLQSSSTIPQLNHSQQNVRLVPVYSSGSAGGGGGGGVPSSTSQSPNHPRPRPHPHPHSHIHAPPQPSSSSSGGGGGGGGVVTDSLHQPPPPAAHHNQHHPAMLTSSGVAPNIELVISHQWPIGSLHEQHLATSLPSIATVNVATPHQQQQQHPLPPHPHSHSHQQQQHLQPGAQRVFQHRLSFPQEGITSNNLDNSSSLVFSSYPAIHPQQKQNR